jgi:L-gulonate 5-dehydrogenase
MRGIMPKGLKLIAPKQMEIIEFNLTGHLENDEILLRVKTGGICGSDIHIYDGSHPIGDYPKIIGHEFAGIIEDIGAGVENLISGDSVVVNPIINCGNCYACTVLNRPNICSNLRVRGVHLDGGFCTHVILPASSVYKFQNISWKAAPLVEPFTVGAQILERSRLTRNDTILINGAGAIGMSTLILARHAGAKIIASDLFDSHLKKATALGADLTVNPQKFDLHEEIMSFTKGNGVSVVVESVGNTGTFNSVVKCASPGARIILIGFDKKNLGISPFDLTFNEFEIIGSRMNTHKFEPMIKLFESGEINPEEIVSNVFSYTKAPEVFPHMIKHPDEVIKVILEF